MTTKTKLSPVEQLQAEINTLNARRAVVVQVAEMVWRPDGDWYVAAGAMAELAAIDRTLKDMQNRLIVAENAAIYADQTPEDELEKYQRMRRLRIEIMETLLIRGIPPTNSQADEIAEKMVYEGLDQDAAVAAVLGDDDNDD